MSPARWIRSATALFLLGLTAIFVGCDERPTAPESRADPAPSLSTNPTGGGPFAYVGSRGIGNNVLTVLDASAGDVETRITTRDKPHRLGSTPDGRFIYAPNHFGFLSIIDVATNTVAKEFRIGTFPREITFSPDGSRAYVVESLRALKVVDTGSQTLLKTISLPDRADHLAVTPDGSRIYVPHGSNLVSVVDASTQSLLTTVSVDNPDELVVTPDGGTVYVVDHEVFSPGGVTAIDVATNTVKATATTGRTPRRPRITPDGEVLFVANLFDHDVSVIETDTNTEVKQIQVGGQPAEMAMAPDGSTLYVAIGGGEVKVIDVASRTISNSFDAEPPNLPKDIEVSPDGEWVVLVGRQFQDSGRPTDKGRAAIIDASNPSNITHAVLHPHPSRIEFPAGGGASDGGDEPENRPPVADAGLDQTLECTGPDGAGVILDGSGSSDPDSDGLTYEWLDEEGSVVATGESPSVTLPLGTHELTLRVTDDQGASDTDAVEITVEDTTAPSANLELSPREVWPPNHRYVEIDVRASADDLCDSELTLLGSVASDEADDARGRGDGATTGDIRVTRSDGTVVTSSDARTEVSFDPASDRLELRAERSGRGDGRTYTVSFTAVDDAGNRTTVTATVDVPYDRGRGNR